MTLNVLMTVYVLLLVLFGAFGSTGCGKRQNASWKAFIALSFIGLLALVLWFIWAV